MNKLFKHFILRNILYQVQITVSLMVSVVAAKPRTPPTPPPQNSLKCYSCFDEWTNDCEVIECAADDNVCYTGQSIDSKGGTSWTRGCADDTVVKDGCEKDGFDFAS